MQEKEMTGRRNDVVECKNCGEMYSTTYKECPFCDGGDFGFEDVKPMEVKQFKVDLNKPLGSQIEKEGKQTDAIEPEQKEKPEQKEETESVNETEDHKAVEVAPKSKVELEEDLSAYLNDEEEEKQEYAENVVRTTPGKRLKKSSGGGAMRILSFFLSIAIIIGAGYVVATKVVPMFVEDKEPVVDQQTSFAFKQEHVKLTQAEENYALKFQNAEEDLTSVIWTSTDLTVASVTEEGVVTAVGQGSATISAVRENGDQADCTIVCIWERVDPEPLPEPEPNPEPEEPEQTTLALSRTDFTLAAGESFKVEIIGSDAEGIWHISNKNVANVSGAGVVKHVGKGRTTLTVTVEGQQLTCTVRCS